MQALARLGDLGESEADFRITQALREAAFAKEATAGRVGPNGLDPHENRPVPRTQSRR